MRTPVRRARPAVAGAGIFLALGAAMLAGLFLIWRMKNAPEERPPAKPAASVAAVTFVPAVPSGGPSALPWESGSAAVSSGGGTSSGNVTFVSASQPRESLGRPVGFDSPRMPPPPPPPAMPPPVSRPSFNSSSAVASAASFGFKAPNDPNAKKCTT